jgi:hypothetical protein
MNGVTIAVAVIGALLGLIVNPVRAMGILIASTILYPEYLRVPVGLAQMSAQRMIAIVLLIRFVTNRRLTMRFRLNGIDKLVVLWWVWDVTATCLAGADQEKVIWCIGRFFDTVVMYAVARFALLGFEETRNLILPLSIAVSTMGCIGILESVTFHSPYHTFEGYYSWLRWGIQNDYRFGLLRARGSSAMPAYFGMSLLLITGMLFSLRGYVRFKPVLMVLVGIGFLGTLSSLSSGPMIGLAVFIFGNVFLLRPSAIKPAVVGFLCLFIAAEVFSNRHFYYLIEYLNVFGGDYWYRCRLVDVAIRQWRDYWLFGAGGRSVDHWGPLVDGRSFVDLVNNYVCIALSGGILGLVLYVGAQCAAIRNVAAAFRAARQPERRSEMFSLACLMIAQMVSGFQIATLGPTNLLTFILLGMMTTGNIRTSAIPVAKKKPMVVLAAFRRSMA